MNFYKHYLGDFQRDTNHLSLTERGAYLALIHHYYATETPLPNEHSALCRIAGAFTKPERDAVKSITRFFELRDGKYWHKRIEAELEKQEHLCDKNRAIALAREKRKRAELVTKKEHENSTKRAPNVQRNEHENSTPQNQNHTQLNTLEPNGSSQNMPESGSFDPPNSGLEKPKTAEKPKKTGLPDCPYGLILDLWGKHLPHLAQPRIWEGNRKQTMRQRWVQASKPSDYSPSGYANESGGLEWWDEFFAYIAKDTNLAQGFESKGRTWKPDLAWVCNAENFQKIIDGKYDK